MLKRYTVNAPTTLKKFTDDTDAQASFALPALLRAREVRVNGKKTGEDLPLAAGDEVSYFLTAAQAAKRAYAVLYEDDAVLVADKESGVNSEAVYADLQRKGEFYFIHRLDRNTEGVLIFAKTKAAEGELLACFKERRAEKRYLALVFGVPSPPSLTATAYLEKDAESALVRVNLSRRGEEIVTSYETLERRGETTLLSVTLGTGKTHQIRAHLAFLGYPVVGDGKYGDAAKNRALHATRQRLVAKELVLHPAGVLSYLDGKKFISEKTL